MTDETDRLGNYVWNTQLLSMIQALSKKFLLCHWTFFLPIWTEYISEDGYRTLDTCTLHFFATASKNSSEDDGH